MFAWGGAMAICAGIAGLTFAGIDTYLLLRIIRRERRMLAEMWATGPHNPRR